MDPLSHQPRRSKASVSVVIPCFRCAQTVGRAVDSLRAQTALPAEIVFVDDMSGDDTGSVLARLVSELQGSVRAKLITLERNAGAATARNAGWSAAREKYVAFLDADATWHPRKVELQYRFMEANPEVAVSGHLHRVTRGAVGTIGVPEELAAVRVAFGDLLWKNRFVTSSAMLRRNLAHRFVDGQRHMEDHRLWLEIAHAGERVVRIEAPLAAHHKPDFGADGLSADLVAMERAELGNYRALFSAGAIGVGTLGVLHLWSIAKFIRRLVIVALRRTE